MLAFERKSPQAGSEEKHPKLNTHKKVGRGKRPCLSFRPGACGCWPMPGRRAAGRR